jgi:hypothetical protein
MPDSKRRSAIEAYLQEEVKVKLPILPQYAWVKLDPP